MHEVHVTEEGLLKLIEEQNLIEDAAPWKEEEALGSRKIMYAKVGQIKQNKTQSNDNSSRKQHKDNAKTAPQENNMLKANSKTVANDEKTNVYKERSPWEKLKQRCTAARPRG
jgi:hypothetical protein